ncbi:MAG: TlpA family protein disulfide reductase [Alphaproteobacteria bacterium]|nr:TlpA family protein disulfide reductase [Alphaproteobacteria bacterium]
MKRHFLALLFACVAGTAIAGELRPFTADTLTEIKAQYAGRPFMLTLWSLTCHHCAKELQTLGRLARKDKTLPLAIVSTDTPADAQDIQAALKRFGLDHLDTWVFADAVPERLRRGIDPVWRGELPRSYLFDTAHRAQAHSGMLDEKRIAEWLGASRPVK